MAVPAVHTSTMSAARQKLKPGMKSIPWGSRAPKPMSPPDPWWRANTKPVDCTSASATVRYRVHCVIFFCPT